MILFYLVRWKSARLIEELGPRARGGEKEKEINWIPRRGRYEINILTRIMSNAEEVVAGWRNISKRKRAPIANNFAIYDGI